MSHTKGPWNPCLDDEGNASVTWVDEKGTSWPVAFVYLGSDSEQGRSTTYLIAAAPTMYNYIYSKACSGDNEAIQILGTIDEGLSWPQREATEPTDGEK